MTTEPLATPERPIHDAELAQDRQAIERGRVEVALGHLAVEHSQRAIRESKALLERAGKGVTFGSGRDLPSNAEAQDTAPLSKDDEP